MVGKVRDNQSSVYSDVLILDLCSVSRSMAAQRQVRGRITLEGFWQSLLRVERNQSQLARD
eukprot:1151454-Pelagomonas_calceolata.AAC.6